MMRNRPSAILLLLLISVGCLSGCIKPPPAPKSLKSLPTSNPASTSSPDAKRTDLGKVDFNLAGTYQSTDKKSTLKLLKNGTYTLQTSSAVKLRNGKKKPVQGTVEGKWSVKENHLSLVQKSGYSGTYDFTLKGEKLVLRSGIKSKPVGYMRLK